MENLPASSESGIWNMASDAIEVAAKMAPSEEDLTDNQIVEMPAHATAHLREQEEAKMFETNAPQRFTFPKMNVGAHTWSSEYRVYVRR